MRHLKLLIVYFCAFLISFEVFSTPAFAIGLGTTGIVSAKATNAGGIGWLPTGNTFGRFNCIGARGIALVSATVRTEKAGLQFNHWAGSIKNLNSNKVVFNFKLHSTPLPTNNDVNLPTSRALNGGRGAGLLTPRSGFVHFIDYGKVQIGTTVQLNSTVQYVPPTKFANPLIEFLADGTLQSNAPQVTCIDRDDEEAKKIFESQPELKAAYDAVFRQIDQIEKDAARNALTWMALSITVPIDVFIFFWLFK